jgi:hypothetical protein
MTLSHWGETHLPKANGKKIKRRHTTCGHLFKPTLACSECGEPIGPGQVEYVDTPVRQPA